MDSLFIVAPIICDVCVFGPWFSIQCPFLMRKRELLGVALFKLSSCFHVAASVL